MRKWRCEQCKRWIWRHEEVPTLELKGCIAYLGKPTKKQNVINATYLYCSKCRC